MSKPSSRLSASIRALSVIAMISAAAPGTSVRAQDVSQDAIEEIVEPYLIQQGFIQRTPRGRMLTARAWEHLGLAAPKDLAAMQSNLFGEDG